MQKNDLVFYKNYIWKENAISAIIKNNYKPKINLSRFDKIF